MLYGLSAPLSKATVATISVSISSIPNPTRRHLIHFSATIRSPSVASEPPRTGPEFMQISSACLSGEADVVRRGRRCFCCCCCCWNTRSLVYSGRCRKKAIACCHDNIKSHREQYLVVSRRSHSVLFVSPRWLSTCTPATPSTHALHMHSTVSPESVIRRLLALTGCSDDTSAGNRRNVPRPTTSR